jgi:hypothetical protein
VNKNPTSAPKIAGKKISLPELFVTLSVSLAALGLVGSQFLANLNPDSQVSFTMLNQRASILSKIADPIKRDSYCIPLSAYGRSLDRALDKDARVFFSGMVGKTNGGKGGYYFFLSNYLFPRDVDLSLGTNAIFHQEHFEGVDCTSPDVLRSNGYDLMLRCEGSGIQLIPLTQRGVPHE